MGSDDPSSLFKDIEARLKTARERRTPPARARERSPVGMAMRLSLEMVAGLVVGVGIGYVLDRWLGTAPWLLILFFFLGAAAGMKNVMRSAGRFGRMDEDDGSDDETGDDDRSPPSS